MSVVQNLFESSRLARPTRTSSASLEWGELLTLGHLERAHFGPGIGPRDDNHSPAPDSPLESRLESPLESPAQPGGWRSVQTGVGGWQHPAISKLQHAQDTDLNPNPLSTRGPSGPFGIFRGPSGPFGAYRPPLTPPGTGPWAQLRLAQTDAECTITIPWPQMQRLERLELSPGGEGGGHREAGLPGWFASAERYSRFCGPYE